MVKLSSSRERRLAVEALAAALATGLAAGLALTAGCQQQPPRNTAAAPPRAAGKGGAAVDTGLNAASASGVAGQDDSNSAAQGSPAGAGVKGAHNLPASVSALELDLSNGTVTVTAADAGAALHADWEVKSTGSIGAAPADTLQVFYEDLPGGKVKIYDKYTGPKLAAPPQITLTVALPASAAVTAALGNGKLSIDSNAQLSASLGNGTLTLAGNYPASTVNLGNGSLKGDVQFSQGKHEVHVGNGSVDLALRGGSSLSYDANTGIGAIQLSGIAGQVEKALVSQTASGTVGAGGATLDISVGNGGIKLHEAGSAGAG